jgi:hypothetical protein
VIQTPNRNKDETMKTTRRTLLNIEALETRALASVTAISVSTSWLFGTKQINISTNNNNSNVTIDKTSTGITVKDSTNNFSKTITASGLQAVVFIGLDGNDRVVNNVSTLALRAFGYKGNDYFVGGSKNDLLDGGVGNDTLLGNGGKDRLYGGNGNDLLEGGDGNDKLLGEAGRDWLVGGNGNDYLNGGDGTDTIDGGNGMDTFRRSLYFPGYQLSAEAEASDVPVDVTGAFLNETVTADTRDQLGDIDQVGTATCAFLASLSAYAQRTNQSKDLIQMIEYDPNKDQYGIHLHIGGKEKIHWVNGDWTESRDPGGKLWVTLYQKAYLQALGIGTRDTDGRLKPTNQWTGGTSYRSVHNAFMALTGVGASLTANSSMNAQTMRNYVHMSIRGMVAISNVTGTNGGIMRDHAYAVQDVYQKNGAWRVVLYNPYGHDSAGGVLTGTNDGIIDISWNTFKANFRGYRTCL